MWLATNRSLVIALRLPLNGEGELNVSDKVRMRTYRSPILIPLLVVRLRSGLVVPEPLRSAWRPRFTSSLVMAQSRYHLSVHCHRYVRGSRFLLNWLISHDGVSFSALHRASPRRLSLNT
jgi:hypothetical protein